MVLVNDHSDYVQFVRVMCVMVLYEAHDISQTRKVHTQNSATYQENFSFDSLLSLIGSAWIEIWQIIVTNLADIFLFVPLFWGKRSEACERVSDIHVRALFTTKNTYYKHENCKSSGDIHLFIF